ncbi:hypothetical protein [Nocardiopsis sp. FIRDI 009]|uniref:hypothetical protein n=1 Tax=Nocardiopsis sp. FIRDI 009 TaxID=714197 RepID=UPI000E226149|nr:hypothetical protein [Nocardiopsis sp. FIRDI 009]
MPTREETTIGPSGICRRGQHRWQHVPPGGKRLVCTRCQSMSMNNYGSACRSDCADCHPRELTAADG